MKIPETFRLSLVLVAALALGAQGDRKPLAFEVISVKKSAPGARGGGVRPLAGGQTYVARGTPVRLLIKLMYKLSDSQIAGGPGWMDTELYDVDAKAAEASNIDQLHEMFQTLLADRFQFKFHRETREIRAYVLTLDKGGSKMKVNESPEPFDFPMKPTGPGKFAGNHVDMQYLCWFVSQPLNTPVLDQTGLKGFYDFTIEAQPPQTPEGTDPVKRADEFTAALFTAMREQLGLKIESKKAPVEVFVVDRLERPADN